MHLTWQVESGSAKSGRETAARSLQGGVVEQRHPPYPLQAVSHRHRTLRACRHRAGGGGNFRLFSPFHHKAVQSMWEAALIRRFILAAVGLILGGASSLGWAQTLDRTCLGSFVRIADKCEHPRHMSSNGPSLSASIPYQHRYATQVTQVVVQLHLRMLPRHALAHTTSPDTVRSCGISPRAGIHVIAEPKPAVALTDFDLAQIASLAQRAGNTGNSSPQGFYFARFRDEISVNVSTGPESICTKHIRIEIGMQLANRRIEIAQELRARPCQFFAVLQHYQKKAQADVAVFARYVNSTTAMLGGTPLPAITVPTDQLFDATVRTQVERWVKLLVGQTLETFHSARIAAQQAVDTPDEMMRLAVACSGHT